MLYGHPNSMLKWPLLYELPRLHEDCQIQQNAHEKCPIHVCSWCSWCVRRTFKYLHAQSQQTSQIPVCDLCVCLICWKLLAWSAKQKKDKNEQESTSHVDIHKSKSWMRRIVNENHCAETMNCQSWIQIVLFVVRTGKAESKLLFLTWCSNSSPITRRGTRKSKPTHQLKKTPGWEW